MYGQQTATLNVPPGGIRYVGESVAPQENRALPIHEHMQELETKLHRLHETIEALAQRLSCVSCPQPPLVEKETVRHPGGSGMSAQLSNLVAMVDGAGTKVRQMYDALEI